MGVWYMLLGFSGILGGPHVIGFYAVTAPEIITSV
jgi:hypothetical protein